MNKKIFIIGAGELQIPLIKTAKEMGLTVIASDKDPEAPGFAFVDTILYADTMNPDETLSQIKQYAETQGAPNGVLTAGSDASLAVATVVEYFKLQGHSVEAALNCTDKILMRQVLSKASVPIPAFETASSRVSAKESLVRLGGQAVFKPADNMGARGVSLVSDESQADAAYTLAADFSRNKQEILVEQYIDSDELSIDALVYDGNVVITGVADRIIEHAPYFVETGHILPSSKPPEQINKALDAFLEAIKVLGLRHGAAKGDIKISPEGVHVIEIAARLSGGFMSSYTFPLATGINLNECALRLALGENIPVPIPTKNMTAVERAIMSAPGTLVNILVPENLGAAHISLRKKAGDIISEPKNNLDKIGNIIVCAPTRLEAVKAANKAVRRIKIEIEPSQPLPQLIKDAEDKARQMLSPGCIVCPECNGISCRGKIPGVGGVGTGEGFIQSYKRFREIKILPSYVHNIRQADASIEMFGVKCSLPVFPAPIAGAKPNYNNAVSELFLQTGMIKGAFQAGTVALSPDPATYELFGAIEDTILQNYGHTVTICKPRIDLSSIYKRIDRILAAGALGIGTDIDGIGLKTFNKAEACGPKNITELKSLVDKHPSLFVVKGVLSHKDAENALKAGATHIVISNHGGRIGEAFPPAIDMLPSLKSYVGNKALVLVDGAIRTAADVLKCIILGADGVLIGRPCAYLAVGGGSEAVRAYLLNLKNSIESLMLLLGAASIDELKGRTELIRDLRVHFNI